MAKATWIVLTLSGYREAGGVKDAIAKLAEETLTRMAPEQARVARIIFLNLIGLGEGAEDTRRVASLKDLATRMDEEQLNEVLVNLVAARLITIDGDDIEIAHSALIHRWPRLLDWLENEREQLLIERKLQRDADDWVISNRDPSLLYRGNRLKEALERKAEINSRLVIKKNYS